MTRINIVPPSKLIDKFLLAEYKEILRLPKLIQNYRKRQKKNPIPETFSMGSGHVTFFYNKAYYLWKRFQDIVVELELRGVKCSQDFIKLWDYSNFNGLYKDWQPEQKDFDIINHRLIERMCDIVSKNKQLKFKGEIISLNDAIIKIDPNFNQSKAKISYFGYNEPVFDGYYNWCNCSQPTLTSRIFDRGQAHCWRCDTPFYK